MLKLARMGGLALFRDRSSPPDTEVTLSHVLQTLVIAGTPESVVEQILRFREEAGPFGTLIYTGHDWADPALARRSMELMATEVMPRVNEALRPAAEGAR
jgi:alkanesulfonate monooxygenase SsuD/methylene tetrahydromethanopterin reductase-like flavin-dependent oxidoreductase (luciferase family)